MYRTPFSLVAAIGLLLGAPGAWAAEIVGHPDELQFPELEYQPPAPGEFRHKLECGATAYIAENHEVPTFEMTVLIRTGSMYVPVNQAGLAGMTAYLMRNGGAGNMTASEIDERLAYLAATVSVRIREDQGRVSLFCLAKDMDEGLEILWKILDAPAFDQEALDRHRTDILSELEQRNASTSSIESREWAFLMYGDHPSTNHLRRTEASIKAISRQHLIGFHDSHFHPETFTLAISGDFETDDVIAKLDALFARRNEVLLRGGQLPEIQEQIADPRPGVYMIEKADVNQSRVRIGHLGVKRDNPDQYALQVMNDILGGGGFSSRITRRVRSDEGLAYSTGSRFERPVLYPGTFRAWFQTKHATAAFGTRLIVDEIKRIREEKVDEETIDVSKASFVGRLVTPFSSKSGIVNTFAGDDYTGRGDDYWQNYKQNIEAVTADDILAAAQRYLHPEKLVCLVVGDPDAAQQGSDKHAERFSQFGKIEILPLRDPLTLE